MAKPVEIEVFDISVTVFYDGPENAVEKVVQNNICTIKLHGGAILVFYNVVDDGQVKGIIFDPTVRNKFVHVNNMMVLRSFELLDRNVTVLIENESIFISTKP